MYCIILNYTTAQTDILELPENDYWDECKIEEYGQDKPDSDPEREKMLSKYRKKKK